MHRALCQLALRLLAGLAGLILFSGTATAEQKPLWEAGAGFGVVNFPDYRGSDERSSFALPIPAEASRSGRVASP